MIILGQNSIPEKVANAFDGPLYALCPTMDVFCYVAQQGDVALSRLLSWQRVWTIPARPGKNVVSLAWRPDGLVIAIAYVDGLIRLHSIETAALVHEFNLKQSIQRLWWLEDTKDNLKTKENDLLLQNLPKLPPLTRSSQSSVFKPKESKESMEEAHQMGKMSFLLALVNQNDVQRIHLSLYGIFHVGLLPTTFSQIHQITSCESQLILLTNDAVSRLDLGLVHEQRVEMHGLATRGTTFNMLATYLTQTISHIDQEAKSFMGLASKYLGMFDDLLTQEGAITSPRQEFIQALVTGKRSDLMDKFLNEELGDRLLKQWEKSLETGIVNMTKWNTQYAQPCCQRILLHLSNLIGLARCKEGSNGMGVGQDQVKSCIQAIYFLSTRLKEMEKKSMKYLTDFRPLMDWMNAACAESMEDVIPPLLLGDELKMVEFVESDFEGASLEPFFHGESNLKQLADNVTKLLQSSFAEPSKVICNSIKSLSDMEIEYIPEDVACFNDVLVSVSLGNSVKLGRFHPDSSSFEISLQDISTLIQEQFNVNPMATVTFTEARFYDEQYLVLLVNWMVEAECPEDCEFLPDQALLLVDYAESLSTQTPVVVACLDLTKEQDDQILSHVQPNSKRKLVSLLGDERRKIVLIDVEGEAEEEEEDDEMQE